MKPSGDATLDIERLDLTFAALADPTRRAILTRLAAGDASVMELAEPFAMTQPAISKHLKVLERAGLVSRRRDAQRRPCHLQAEVLREATQWLDGYRRFWSDSFDQLDDLLDQLQSGPDNDRPASPAEQRRPQPNRDWSRPNEEDGGLPCATPAP